MLPWISKNLVYRPATWLRGEPVFRLLREYEESQWWSADRIAEAQADKLEAILRHAVDHSPFYAERARQAGLERARIAADDLVHLEPLVKTDLVASVDRINVPMLRGTYSWKTTGGSTGVPVRLRKNRFATAAEQAASWRSYGWYGIRPGDRQARFWGTPLTGKARTRARSIDWVLNRDRFSAFAFTREDLAAYFRRLRSVRPTWVYGYVSMLVEFARYCLEESLDLGEIGIRAVVTTSEALMPADREIISKGFGAPVYNEYGCGEVGAVLYECERGLLHLMAENLLLELVPAPTEDRPDAHRLLVTDLHNRATPMIRYDISDRVVPAPPCPCGRALPAFREVFGRAYDFIEAPDGTRYHGEFFMYHLEEARDEGLPIVQAQFEQVARDTIEIRVVGSEGLGERHERDFADRIRRASGDRFRIEVGRVDALARSRSGKIRLIIALPAEQAPTSPVSSSGL